MLSTPENGWINISVKVRGRKGEKLWVGRASYLTKPHFDLLDAFIDVLTCKLSSSVFFDAEGWNINIVFNDFSVYIIEDKDKLRVYEYVGIVEDLMRECCDDIKRDIDLWSEWGYEELSSEDIANYKAEINSKLEKVYGLLNRGVC